ncbi:Eosinophil peroxidase [Bagarius yarrelli]|uniref:Eosinophil peroxidase n=1 Tax=Bagarius yarrelli TaxID=175774 RepID=A0A556THW9_BAGYA|nr:Eosinophil peroxidase [Bagarius yarrelli]
MSFLPLFASEFPGKNEPVYVGSTFIQEALRRARELTDAAYARTNERVKMSVKEGSFRPSDLLAQFKQIGTGTRAHIRAAELLENTVELIREMVYTHTMAQPKHTELLSRDDVEILLAATGCSAEIKRPVCKGDCLSKRYRTITGHCNNRLFKTDRKTTVRQITTVYIYGEQNTNLLNLGDDVTQCNSRESFQVRVVSQEVLYTQNENISLDLSLSHLLVEWGQWIDHDLSLTPQSPSTASFKTGADCTRTCSKDTPCFPIQIPLLDPRRGVQSCMPFFRSAPSCVDASVVCRHREQLNAITAFVDASMVYGSSDELARSLRNLSSPLGLLKHNQLHSDRGLAYLPYLPRANTHVLDPCAPREGSRTGRNTTSLGNLTFCFLAGDSRVNEHLGMIALHTLFLREHNRLAKELHMLNPHWSQDTLYQEARKILGAVHQVLTWDHYLPHILGQSTFANLMPSYQGYDPEIDPSITNGFSTAAFRFAHVTVQPTVNRLGAGYHPDHKHPPLPLHHSLFASWRVVEEGGIDPLLRGLLLSPAKLQAPEQMMVEELTERLFQAHGGLPLDLGALNLQRGRDHGLPGYAAWREFCGLSVPANESDLIQILENVVLVRKLLALYGTVWNIDVWVGAISEPALSGGRVGPLLACLIAKQFQALRDGDRFWWEHEGVFSAAQRRSLRTVSLSRIICDNTQICLVPSDPFTRTLHPDKLLPCTHMNITHLNLSAWKEPDTDPVCGSIPRLKVGFSVLCDSAVMYQCPSGYMLHGASRITCDPNTRLWTPNPPTCQDIDECFSGHVCPPDLLCYNTPGSFICTEFTTHSATSIAAAVVTVVVGAAVMVLIVSCYKRWVFILHLFWFQL